MLACHNGHAQQDEWNGKPTIFGVNTLKPHATSMPYSTIADALKAERKKSEWYQTLTGTWKFFHVDKPSQRNNDFYADNYNVSKWDDIAVPGSWQVQGYDHPIYSNVIYPWAASDNIRQPTAPTNFNPVGHYRRTFKVPANWNGKRIRLHFEGVESAYYVWINGKYVGYSENTFTDHEFDITDKLRDGENNISVQVFRWCDGSWLEDQDFIRLAGIFRDVYIYASPKVNIQDFQINASLASNYKDGDFNATVWVDNFTPQTSAPHTLQLQLYDKATKKLIKEETKEVAALGSGREASIRFQFAVASPALWSAESPSLYTVVMVLRDENGNITETESAHVGFRKVELKKDANGMTRYYINNQPIKFRGVNRHELDPDNGRVMTTERLYEDVLLMKRFNINALRTSHYPNDPRIYDMCDSLGIYVLDENNLETHGANNEIPKNDDNWRPAAIERMSSMIQRDKNHPCVVVWSLGNEAGNGNVFTSILDYAHQADPTRPVHYEGDWNNADVNSWMYYGPDAVRFYNNNNKPIMLCEYEHAMGNSVGDLREYMDAFYANPRSFGGFIWDFIDQGLRRGTSNYFNYGGLWGDRPNDGNFCANGLVFPDRSLQPEIFEVKHQYRNILAKDKDVNNGTIILESRYNFVNIADMAECVWTLSENGKVIQEGTLDASQLDVAPSTSKTITIPFKKPNLKDGADYYLDLDFQQKEDTYWEKAGYSIAHEQFKLSLGNNLPAKINTASVGAQKVTDNATALTVEGSDFSVKIDKGTGTISDYTLGSVQLIKKGAEPNFWRAPTDNDRGNGMEKRCGAWRYAGSKHTVKSCNVTRVSDQETKIDFEFGLPETGSSTMKMTYTIYGSGDVIVEYTVYPDKSQSELPNVGTLFTIPGGFEKVNWFGKGPHENYVGRCEGAYMGLHSTLADSMTVFYMKNGETGQRSSVKWATLTNSTGLGLMVVGSPLMEFSAQHYTPEQFTSVTLPWDLKRDNDITLRVDLQQMGLGGVNSWGAKPMDAYQLFSSKSYSHKFRITPLRGTMDDYSELANLGFKNLQTSNTTVDYPQLNIKAPTQEPYTEIKVPGTIQAEDFDKGGEGLSYHDNDMANQGGAYRDDCVDIVALSDGYAVGYTSKGEWMEYTINVKEDGTYPLTARVSSGLSGAGFRLFIDGKAISDTVKIPQGENWDTYSVVNGGSVKLAAGEHVMRMELTGSYGNIDWLKIGDDATGITTISTSDNKNGRYTAYTINGNYMGEIDLVFTPDPEAVAQYIRKKGFKNGIYIMHNQQTNRYIKVELRD